MRGLRFAGRHGEFSEVTRRRTLLDSLHVKGKEIRSESSQFPPQEPAQSSKIHPDWVYATASSEQLAASS